MFTVFKKRASGLSVEGLPKAEEGVMPVIGNIPWLPRGQYADLFPPPVEYELAPEEWAGKSGGEQRVPIHVAYQWLAFTLKELGEREPTARTLLLTSCGLGNSSSWMSMNLAYYLHKANQRVLLIDGDFQNPTVHQAFDQDFEEGISLYGLLRELQGEEGQYGDKQAFLNWGVERLERCISEVPGLPGLALFPNTDSTVPVDIEVFKLLNGAEWGWILDRLRLQFDWILVDAAPFLNNVSPLILAKQTGGIVVFDERDSQPERLARIADLATINQVPLIGFVAHQP